MKALEEELLYTENANHPKRPKTASERARPKIETKIELAVKVPEEEEEEEDPFDTSIVDKVLSGEKEEEKKKIVSVEDDDFDPRCFFPNGKIDSRTEIDSRTRTD